MSVGRRTALGAGVAVLAALGGFAIGSGVGDPARSGDRGAASAGAAPAQGGAEGSRADAVRIEWRKDPGTRIDDGSVPYVHKVGSGKYRLYYCGPGGILSAVSSDALTVTKEPGVRLAPAGQVGDPEGTVCDPTVVRLAGGGVRMYYKGADGQGGPGQAVHRVYSATSPDGLDFLREGLRIDSTQTGDHGWASVPEANGLTDGRVRIYYVSGAAVARGGIMSAISGDGLSFRREAGARLEGMVDPAIIRMPTGDYLLLATKLPSPPTTPGSKPPPGQTGIYSYTSHDGLAFGHRRTVLRESGVYDPSIVSISSRRFRVFYGKDLSQQGQPHVVTKSLTGTLRT